MLSRRAALALAGAALAGCSALVGCSAPAPASQPAAPPQGAASGFGRTLDAPAFAELVATPGVVVLDVRTPAEFAAGHLRDAVNVDIEGADFAARLAGLDKQVTYAVYCRSGNRSQVALDAMAQAGFADAHHLGGGIGAWQANGGEVVT